MPTPTLSAAAPASAVNRAVSYAHVLDVDASLEFYTLLGFVPRNVQRDDQARAFWALAHSGPAEIMFARAGGPIDAEQQAVLFYMYSPDVAGLRRGLLAQGVRDGGVYSGARAPADGPRAVHAVAHPRHMPAGELRVTDPDGYVILVGQLS